MRDTDGECLALLRLDADPDLSLPRIRRLLREGHRIVGGLNRGASTDEQIYVDIAVLVSVDISGNRRDEPRHVRRAARAGKPGAAFVSGGGFQHVRIEEAIALHGNAGQGGVVQRPFEDVDVLRVVVLRNMRWFQ
jgi:hypothetical protein